MVSPSPTRALHFRCLHLRLLRVLTKSEHIQDVFRDSDKHLKAKNNDSGYFLGELLGRCVGLVSQNEWKQLRSVCVFLFVWSWFASFFLQMERRTERHFWWLWVLF